MSEVVVIFIFTAGAGLCIPIGGVLANIEHIRPKWLENELRHAVIAFGGGVLLAAVSFVLLPEGRSLMPHPVFSVFIFLLGGVVFFSLERFLGGRRQEKPQFSAMLLDYIPESLALGGAFAVSAHSAPLLAILIGLQNLPESFNAFRELEEKSNYSGRRLLLFMFLLVPLGPVAAFTGWYFLTDYQQLLGSIMLFSSGGILYLIFQDIAPESKMHRHWAPATGAVIGFAVAMLGTNLLPG